MLLPEPGALSVPPGSAGAAMQSASVWTTVWPYVDFMGTKNEQ